MEGAVFGEGRDPEIDGCTGMQIGQDAKFGWFRFAARRAVPD
jgi:hypothetical protein